MKGEIPMTEIKEEKKSQDIPILHLDDAGHLFRNANICMQKKIGTIKYKSTIAGR